MTELFHPPTCFDMSKVFFLAPYVTIWIVYATFLFYQCANNRHITTHVPKRIREGQEKEDRIENALLQLVVLGTALGCPVMFLITAFWPYLLTLGGIFATIYSLIALADRKLTAMVRKVQKVLNETN